MNANAIATGGGSAKQIDCGYSSTLSGGNSGLVTIYFNFTFTNVPNVVTSIAYYYTQQMYTVAVTATTKSSFTVQIAYLSNGSSTVYNTWLFPFNWIAVG